MLTVPLRETATRRKHKSFGNHAEYLSRITKSLYYVKLPASDCTSLPVTELAAEIFSDSRNKLSLEYLDVAEAARLSHNACVSPCSLVLALLYLDRLKASNPKYLAKVSPSELFLISLMVGSKFLQDDGEEDEVNNCEWAASAGLTVQDVNRAEKAFLDAIEWEVFVSKEEFWNRLKLLETRVGLLQGCKRGWFSYTEMDLLLELIDFAAILQSLFTVTAACLTSYTISVLALLSSAILVTHIPGTILHPSTQMATTSLHLPMGLQNTPLFENHTDCLTKLNQTPETEPLLSSDLPRMSVSLWHRVQRLDTLGRLQFQQVDWGWTDVIRSCLVRESVQTIFFPISTF